MSKLYVKQLLAGRDFGLNDPVAANMQNFVYLIGDTEHRECLIVDPAWAVEEIIGIAAEDDMKVVGALATHYHPDHIGGTMFGFTVEGLPKLLEVNPCPVHVHKAEAAGVMQVTGLSKSDLVLHEGNDIVKVGDIEVELLHTPGHTPGSQCFCVKDSLFAGDTLFLQGCGRVDLPGGDADEMYYTLTQRLNKLPDSMILFPGHAYGGEHAPLGHVRQTNHQLQIPDIETWRRFY